MEKKMLNAMLLTFNVVLAFAIVILIAMIIKRGPKPMEEYQQTENQSIAEQIAASQEEDSVVEDIPEDTSESTLVCVPTSSSGVNVRTGPSTDYQRIGSAYMENSYEIIAILDNGWTKINYDGQTGYISSEYVTYQIRTVYNGAEDTASFIDASEEEISPYRKADDNAPAPPVIEETTGDNGAGQGETTEEAVNNIINEMNNSEDF
ncbi:MAG: SH3 domain-containing protein [Lachnospiraceae bacterium]|nr:SH3 domain-containing protein [Lachnospiraceae bacterium]